VSKLSASGERSRRHSQGAASDHATTLGQVSARRDYSIKKSIIMSRIWIASRVFLVYLCKDEVLPRNYRTLAIGTVHLRDSGLLTQSSMYSASRPK
jgi:hypothetical protein